MIIADRLSKQYGSERAVDDLTFEVRPGVVTGFLGPNGAGKSTTMRMIIGLDRPSSGSVTVNGRPYRSLRWPMHEVGAVLETGALHGGRSAFHHLLCLAQTNGIPARRVDEVLGIVGLGGHSGRDGRSGREGRSRRRPVARRRAGTYSLGMRQRLGLAAALLGDPPVLLCDEPVNGLDPEGIQWIRTFLRRLADEGRTVFVSSHLMSEMSLLADQLVVIGRGRLIAQGTTREIIAGASDPTVTVASPESARLTTVLLDAHAQVTRTDPDSISVTGLAASRIGELAAANGIVLHQLATEQQSLEAAFMTLTRDAVDYRPEAVS